VRAVVTGASAWSLGGADVAPDALPLLAGGLSFHLAPDPPRPDAVPVGTWRRMSRLARLAAVVTAPLVATRADRDDLALFWGTGVGEFSSTAGFLRTLFTKGPAGASPLAFQNSVHNAPAGHLSIALGLRGPSETLCAGPLTALRTLERALAYLVANDRPALVVVGDELGPDVQQGYTFAGGGAPVAEGAAALLLEPAGDGPALTWLDAPPIATDWHRGAAYPLEEPPAVSGRAHDAHYGLFSAVDSVALVALVRSVRAGGPGGAVAWGGPGGPVRVVIG
jgi:3-oxoacyl-[acyl-carrier-protein] synthase II